MDSTTAPPTALVEAELAPALVPRLLADVEVAQRELDRLLDSPAAPEPSEHLRLDELRERVAELGSALGLLARGAGVEPGFERAVPAAGRILLGLLERHLAERGVTLEPPAARFPVLAGAHARAVALRAALLVRRAGSGLEPGSVVRWRIDGASAGDRLHVLAPGKPGAGASAPLPAGWMQA